MDFEVQHQCRVPAEAISEGAFRDPRKDGKTVAAVGSIVDSAKMDARQRDRLIEAGALKEAPRPAAQVFDTAPKPKPAAPPGRKGGK